MAVGDSTEVIVPNPAFRKQVEHESGEKIAACFQCQKCTNGCPVTVAMDILPHKLIRSVHLGLKDKVLKSDTIWVCASCETCTTRCPNDIDIAHIMDTLRQISQAEGVKPSQKNVPLLHKEFLASINRHGKVHEMEMTASYILKSQGLGALMKQTGMGWEMFKKGKLKLLPSRASGEVKKIFKQAKEQK